MKIILKRQYGLKVSLILIIIVWLAVPNSMTHCPSQHSMLQRHLRTQTCPLVILNILTHSKLPESHKKIKIPCSKIPSAPQMLKNSTIHSQCAPTIPQIRKSRQLSKIFKTFNEPTIRMRSDHNSLRSMVAETLMSVSLDIQTLNSTTNTT